MSSDPPDYSTVLKNAGIPEANAPTILGAASKSWNRIVEARDALAALQRQGGVSAIAFGSLGRYEMTQASDLDLAFIYDPKEHWPGRADAIRDEVVEKLRGIGFDIPEKTFVRALTIDELATNVGGARETNELLTHRALLLTEGAFLLNKDEFARFRDRIFRAYSEGTTTAGRHLTSLTNDLHRYYRTLCVDYRFKIEEDGKHWALRLMKLRHSRKLWHFANVVTQCVLVAAHGKGPDNQVPTRLGAELQKAPLLRVVEGAHKLGRPGVCVPIFEAYERFLSLISRPDVRGELEGLRHDDRHGSKVFGELDQNAQKLQHGINGMIDLLESVPARKAYIRRYVLS